jgi:hypothetical protein
VVVATPYARIGDSGRVLHHYWCVLVRRAEYRRDRGDTERLPLFLTGPEAVRFTTLYQHRPCQVCACDIGAPTTRVF